jgi:hypothetical protein
MEMIKIPHTDLEVSRLALGCMGLFSAPVDFDRFVFHVRGTTVYGLNGHRACFVIALSIVICEQAV